ncbi:M35 family metallo-endopeptidase [Massilia oculi]|uniref:Peptidase M35 n=1 Tax=Massilia oculi TaxID=945844 RepID=A0A2S2DLZ0_9BURK|nr:M35 family metallo-endopeptidase [Massilia oculi]AWL06347.1 peptidase M35 [Massilia oculi]
MSPHPILPSAAVAALVLSLTCGGATAVEVTVTPVKPTVERGDDVMVRVTLTNTTGATAHLLRWRTPLDGVEAPLFEVRRDGQPVRYLGRRIKRAAPGPSDYVRLDPGASLSKTVELSRLYEMSVTGNYTIRYHSAAMPAPGAGVQPVVGELVSKPVSIWVDGRLPRGAKPAGMAPEPGGAGLSYANCSNAQQEQLVTAMDAGRAMTVDSHAYLTSGKQYGERYSTWFGALDAARGAKVTSNFTAIKDAFENKPVRIDCDCDEPYFAYVYPARPYTVWVCRAFWAAAVTGTDSRGGTLLHELSHFDVVAATDDHVYGQAGAAELARSAPERAINNADSHEYFGENTPVQQ